MAENDEEQAQGPRREKLYDGRFLNRLKTLEKESEFGDWAFVLGSHCGMVDERVGTLMDLSLQRDDPLAMSVNPEGRRVQTELYHLMILTTVGASMRIVRQVEVGNGLEAWRKLHSRYEPSARGRKLGLLNIILGLSIKEQGVAVMDALNVWEQEVTKYEAKGEDLSEDIRLSLIHI